MVAVTFLAAVVIAGAVSGIKLLLTAASAKSAESALLVFGTFLPATSLGFSLGSNEAS